MEYFDVVRSRHSVRSFADTPVEESFLQAILEAASRAPSAGNLQAYEIYVARNADQRRMLAKAAVDQMFVAEAPLVLVFAANPERSAQKYGQRGRELYAIQDATIACAFAMLACTALELGSVWVGAFNEEQARRIVGVPDKERPVVLLPIGYTKEPSRRTGRRPLNDLVHECELGK